MSALYDYLIKSVIVGDSGTGKSSLMMRFTDDKFNQTFISTVGVDFNIKTIEYQNKKFKFQIWDTAGQERFKSITTSYYRGAIATIICYDTTDRTSFYNVNKWLNEVKKNSLNMPVLILCGTKTDLISERQISYEEGENKAKSLGMKFFECSAKDKFGIENIFEYIISCKINDLSQINNDLSIKVYNYSHHNDLINQNNKSKKFFNYC
jgi:small GTP-binding protein